MACDYLRLRVFVLTVITAAPGNSLRLFRVHCPVMGMAFAFKQDHDSQDSA